jgi:hypothetical protein
VVYRSILHKPGPAAATAALGHTPGARSKHGPAVRVENTERYPDSEPRAYTRPLCSSTRAVSDTKYTLDTP